MKILHIIGQDPDETAKKIIEEHRKSHKVTIVDLRENKNYEQIIDLIEASDKVISW